jgi:curved DNA-binding protein CbpA
MSASRAKPTLYELLGVPKSAGAPEIRAAYRTRMDALESQRRTMPAAEFDDQAQLLRLAFSTLVDPVSRDGYDETLEAAERRQALTPSAAQTDPAVASADVRAEAMSLRADAIALRADALLLKAGLPGSELGSKSASDAGALAFSSLSRVTRALGVLLILGMATFGLTRCIASGATQKSATMEQKAAEQAALQDYYQTYGVRPASLAEMELMEAARRKDEREERQAEQTRRQNEQAARQFHEESRRIGEQVSENLQLAEQAARARAERQRELKFQVEQIQLEIELAKETADRRRLELQKQQTLEQLKQL